MTAMDVPMARYPLVRHCQSIAILANRQTTPWRATAA
jgi:hypothetical protein